MALVTGANHGIGAATAVRLATLGAAVAVTWWPLEADDDPGRPEAYARFRRADGGPVVEACRARGVPAAGRAADLANPRTPEALLEWAEAELGPVSVLVHNASGWRKDTFAPWVPDRFGRRTEPVTSASFSSQFKVDARAGALLIAGFARRLADRGGRWGRIVTLTSGGRDGFPGEVSYGAAKAALESYTMSASVELASLGVTANVVYPPVTDTGWVTEDVRRFVAASPDHVHVAEPDEVAEVIGWLCTDAARLVTGNVIRLR